MTTLVDRPTARAPRRPSVLHEIAAQRRADLERELAGLDAVPRARAAGGRARAPRRRRPPRAAGPPPHRRDQAPLARRPARSPTATLDVAARARAYQAGGASIISVLVENRYWFGGSIDDLRAARAATTAARARQGVRRRRAAAAAAAGGRRGRGPAAGRPPPGAPPRAARPGGARPRPRAARRGARRARAGRRARHRRARHRHQQPRPADAHGRPRRSRTGCATRSRPTASRSRNPASATRRSCGAGVRSASTPRSSARSSCAAATTRPPCERASRRFVDAGADPRPGTDPAADGRRPFVKICGVTEARRPRGRDRRRRRRDRPELRARARRARSPRPRPPQLVARARAAAAPGAGPRARRGLRRPRRRRGGRDRRPARPRRGPAPRRRAARRPRPHPAAGPQGAPPAGRRCRRAAMPPVADAVIERAAALPREAQPRGDPPRHERPDGARRHRAVVPSTDRRGRDRRPRSRSSSRAASTPANVGAARCSTSPPSASTSRAASSRRLGPRVGRRKDPFRVALFVKRARAARIDRPTVAVRTAPGRPGPARAGRARPLGHRSRLRRPLRARDAHGRAARARGRVRRSSGDEPAFWAELRELGHRYVGRPTPDLPRRPPGRASSSAAAGRDARAPAAVPQARGPRPHGRAQDQQRARPGAARRADSASERVIAETGAGQHGVATATACALLDLDCVVYMGAEDIRRQAPNVLRMRALGTEVREVTSGTRDAQGRDQRGDARLGHQRRHDPLRPRVGGRAAPVPARSSATSSGSSATRPPQQVRDVEGPTAGRRDRLRRRRLERDRPAGSLHRRAGDAPGRRRGGGGGTRRPARRRARGRHAGRPARLALVPAPGRRRPGDRRRTRSRPGSTIPASARSSRRSTRPAGSRSCQRDRRRGASTGVRLLTRTEGILPALEPAHAIAALGAWLAGRPTSAPLADDAIVLLGLSGRGDKDLAAIADRLDGEA